MGSGSVESDWGVFRPIHWLIHLADVVLFANSEELIRNSDLPESALTEAAVITGLLGQSL
jgi:hypothetical protein